MVYSSKLLFLPYLTNSRTFQLKVLLEKNQNLTAKQELEGTYNIYIF